MIRPRAGITGFSAALDWPNTWMLKVAMATVSAAIPIWAAKMAARIYANLMQNRFTSNTDFRGAVSI